jgi:tetratricopeptide (TPR) repeat protein
MVLQKTLRCARSLINFNRCASAMLILIFSHAHGQNNSVIDSLESVLKHKVGAARYEPLHKLAVEYVDKDNEKALQFILDAEQAALLSGDSLWIAKSWRAKGQILYRLERMKESMLWLSSALSLSERRKFSKEIMFVNNSLASVYLFLGRFDEALKCYFKTNDLASTLNEQSHLFFSLNNIGVTYYKLRDYAKGLQYFLRASEVEEYSGNHPSTTAMNISLCYANLKDFKPAQKYLQEALENCSSSCSDFERVHSNYTSGVIYLGLGRHREAESAFLSSYAYAVKENDSRMQLDNIYLLSEIYINEERTAKAMTYLQNGENLIRKGMPFNLEAIKLYFRLSKLFLAKGNFRQAAEYQSRYIQLKDSIYNESLTNNLMKIEAEQVERENEARLAAQAETIALKEAIISRQLIIHVVSALLAVSSLILFITLFKSLRQRKNMNNLLERNIRERTFELESSRHELLKLIREKELRNCRAAGDLADGIRTIRGLCLTGSKDISDPVARTYMNKIDSVSDRLNSLLPRL